MAFTPRSFFQSLLNALRLDAPHTLPKLKKLAREALAERWRAQHRTRVLLVDESQRIDLRYHLGGFSPQETAAYIRHHLKLAGADQELFTARALDHIHDRPRPPPPARSGRARCRSS